MTLRLRLLCLQAVNHETGVIQPVDQAIALAHRHGVQVHVDCVQAAGKIEGLAQGADSRSIAGHKMRGPKGIGALVTRPGLRIEPVLRGGSQERGVRPGTLDPVTAAGFAAAIELASPARYREVAALRDRLEQTLGLEVNGQGTRAPHVTNMHVPGWIGPELVAAMDVEGVAVASGPACSAGTPEPSPVLMAMFDRRRALSSVRVSMGDETTMADVERAIVAFRKVLGRCAGGS
jgi:cysteine desulfurase